MKFHFYKYQATGNDFVLVDNRSGKLKFSQDQIEKICNRRLGIGADGLLLIEKHPSLDFQLQYYNSDGSESLCGNGCRAAVHMAASLGLMNGKTSFNAFDGKHDAELTSSGIIRLKMNDVKEVKTVGEDYFINTGSPHIIKFVKDVQHYPVYEEGRKIRYSDPYKPGGTNVNFAELLPGNTIFVRTYERGVENETLSCGTGITAVALAASFKGYTPPVNIKTHGGDLSVEFKTGSSAVQSELSHQTTAFLDIYLIGPAKLVFEGDLEL